MLTVRYDPLSRTGFVRLREGRTAKTRRLSPQATAEYDRRGRLLAIFVTDLDPTAAEFLRTADEETLLRVIRAQRPRGAQEGDPGTRSFRVSSQSVTEGHPDKVGDRDLRRSAR